MFIFFLPALKYPYIYMSVSSLLLILLPTILLTITIQFSTKFSSRSENTQVEINNCRNVDGGCLTVLFY